MKFPHIHIILPFLLIIITFITVPIPQLKQIQSVAWMMNKSMNILTSLKYQKTDDLVDAIGLPKNKLCTYFWDGEEPYA
jgi:hypothetical protein